MLVEILNHGPAWEHTETEALIDVVVVNAVAAADSNHPEATTFISPGMLLPELGRGQADNVPECCLAVIQLLTFMDEQADKLRVGYGFPMFIHGTSPLNVVGEVYCRCVTGQ